MTLAERLFARSDVPSLLDCWIWRGTAVRSRSGKLYGRIWVDGRMQLVHRVSYELFRGPLTGEVDHACEQTLCWNPAHLRDVTTSENRWNHHRDPATQRYVSAYDAELEAELMREAI